VVAGHSIAIRPLRLALSPRALAVAAVFAGGLAIRIAFMVRYMLPAYGPLAASAAIRFQGRWLRARANGRLRARAVVGR
jgi:hypothetical protein